MNEAVPLGQMIGWCQWAPLSWAAGKEAGLIGTAYWVVPLCATQLGCYQLQKAEHGLYEGLWLRG